MDTSDEERAVQLEQLKMDCFVQSQEVVRRGIEVLFTAQKFSDIGNDERKLIREKLKSFLTELKPKLE